MSFDNELEAFREYARVMPKNCVLLVDTYDITQGIKNAITVGLEMKERGETLSAIPYRFGRPFLACQAGAQDAR